MSTRHSTPLSAQPLAAGRGARLPRRSGWWRHLASLGLVGALVLGSLATASTARADALVVVEVRRGEVRVDGIVTLRSRSGDLAYECTTSNGDCTLNGVRGGSYVVTIAPREGSAPAPRRVMIPPAGRVELHLSVGE